MKITPGMTVPDMTLHAPDLSLTIADMATDNHPAVLDVANPILRNAATPDPFHGLGSWRRCHQSSRLFRLVSAAPAMPK